MDSIESFAKQVKRIADTNSRNEKKRILQEIMEEEEWETKLELISGQKFDDIGISTTSATKAIAQASQKPRTVSEVKQEVSDAGSPAEALMGGYLSGGTMRSVVELYSDIEALAGQRGDKQISHLARLLQEYTVPWLVVWCVVHRMKIGVSHNTIAKAATDGTNYSKQEVKDGRALIPNSVEFVRAVKEGQKIDEPSVGTAFKAMKAQSDGMPANTEDWIAQPKLDGYRVIIHVDDGDVSAFTTGLDDRIGVLPELNEIDWPSGKWIFDSEVMASDNSYTKTSERMQRKPSSSLPHTMNFWVFDALVVHGEDISRRPFSERVDKMFESLPEHEYLIPVHGFDDAEYALDQAREMGYEGLVVKHKDHQFEFGERSENWQKVKITEETADLRVRDFKAGTGENAGTLGALKLETEDGVEMGSVGTGFSDEKRDEIWANRDEWEGAIVELTFDADAGYDSGLRFPRFERRRDDKLAANDLDYLKSLVE